ncbi:hypothetical protein ABTE27_21320, partial [Acinetobacter baumannii]
MGADGEQRVVLGAPADAADTEPGGRNPGGELLVIMPLKDWTCASCGSTGSYLTMDDAGPLCMSC